jgi:hypothetical protein
VQFCLGTTGPLAEGSVPPPLVLGPRREAAGLCIRYRRAGAKETWKRAVGRQSEEVTVFEEPLRFIEVDEPSVAV